MISSLAKGGRILNEPRYTVAAKTAADFIIRKLKTKDGRLLHLFRDNTAGIQGFLDDYAFFINSLLDLYETIFALSYLKEAIGLGHKMIGLFEDKTNGGFFLTSVDSGALLTNRIKEHYDGAIPSGNSMAALALLRLYHITLNIDFDKAYRTALNDMSGRLVKSPTAFTQFLIAIDIALSPTKEIVIFSRDHKEPLLGKATSTIYRYFLPNKVILLRTIKGGDDIISIAPWIKEYSALVKGDTTFYICENRVCSLPTADLNELEARLQRK